MRKAKGYGLYNKDGKFGVFDRLTKHIVYTNTLDEAESLIKLLRQEQSSYTKLRKGIR